MSEFEFSDQVFANFCAGRYAFSAWIGDELEQHAIDRQEKLAPYFQHGLRRVREWAEYERRWIASMVKYNEDHFKEFERL